MAAPSNGWVLITGENGTGKELVARQIHARSRRADAPFVEVNCAAIPEELIESELFGHEKGAFTGAVAQKVGKFELAHGGTIFLDEVGDMSLMTQAKVLRILQEQRFSRVGGTETLDVDVRVIAATNKDLEVEIEQGRFREDLYYRLNVIPFRVPPLRERAVDVPMLAREFMAEFCAEAGVKAKKITARAMRALQAHSWPGNVRELRNLMERLVIMTPGPSIDLQDLPDTVRTGSASRVGAAVARGGAPLVRARVPDRAPRRARLEHLAHRRGDRHRAREPLAQDQDLRDRSGEGMSVGAPPPRPDPRRGPRRLARRRGRREPAARARAAALARQRARAVRDAVAGRARVGAALRSATAATDGGVPHARGRRRSRIEILFKVHGRGTALLADLEPGDRVGVVGPLGTPFPDPAPGARAVIAAGGTGIASVYEFAARLHARGVPVRCCSARAARAT